MKLHVEQVKTGWKVTVEIQSDVDKRHVPICSGTGGTPAEGAWYAAHHIRRILDDALAQLASFGCTEPDRP